MPIKPPSVPPFPADLRNELPDPLTPWLISPELFKELQTVEGKLYKKATVIPKHPEWKFVWRYFLQNKPSNYTIKNVVCIHAAHQAISFESNLLSLEKKMERRVQEKKPGWESEEPKDQRKGVVTRWEQLTSHFSPLQITDNGNRKKTLKYAKVLPLFHGTSADKCDSICDTGFTFFGKTSIGGAKPTDPKNTDVGYFGSGIYFTPEGSYAAGIYSKGTVVISWTSTAHIFPVVGDETQTDMMALRGKGAYKDYDGHFVPVTPVDPNDPDCAVCYPCLPTQLPTYHELVVFQSNQTLPRFLINLEVEAPNLINPFGSLTFASDLLPTLIKTLQNEHVDRDKILRDVLYAELAFLHQNKHEYLEDRHYKLHEQLKKLIDASGKIDKTNRLALTNPSKPSLPPSLQIPINTYLSSSNENTTTVATPPVPLPVTTISSPKVPIVDTSIFIESFPKKNWTADPLVQTFIGQEHISNVIELQDGSLAFSDGKIINLWDRSGKCLMSLIGHSDVVTSLIELKDGIIASTSWDKTIKLWDHNGNCLNTLKGHAQSIRTLIELKDGTIASCSEDHTIKLWDRFGNCIKTLTGHQDHISSLIELEDGTIASGSWDKTIKLWDRDGNCLATLEGHESFVTALIELKDGTLASACNSPAKMFELNGIIKLWDRNGNCLNTLKGHENSIQILLELQDGTIASASRDKTIKLWDRNGICLKTLEGHTKSIVALIELKDGSLATGSEDETIKLWDRNGNCLNTLKGHQYTITQLLELKDGTIASTSSSPRNFFAGRRSVKLWSFPSPTEKSNLFNNGNENVPIEPKPSSPLIADLPQNLPSFEISASIQKPVKRDWSADPQIQVLRGHTQEISFLLELKDGTLATGSKDDIIKLWDRNGKCLNTLEEGKSFISLIKLNDDTLAVVYLDNSIKLWDRNGKCLATLKGHTTYITTLIELKDGTLVSRSSDKTIKLWDRTGKCLTSFIAHTEEISCFIELENGTLASSSWDKTIKLWNRNGKCLKILKGHTERIEALIELKGGVLASGSKDKTVKLWNYNGECLKTLEGHTGSIRALIELKDGILASVSLSETKLWDRDGKCLKTLTEYGTNLIELKDGTLASCRSFDKTIKLLNRKENCLKILEGHTESINKFIELNDGTLASCAEDKTIKLWDLNGKCLKTITEYNWVYTITELMDGTLAGCSFDKTIKLWSFPDLADKIASEIPSSSSKTEITSSDQTLVSTQADLQPQISNVNDYMTTEPNPSLASFTADLSPNSPSIDTTVTIQKPVKRDWTADPQIQTFTGHGGAIGTLIKLKDGTLASGSDDNTIKLWNNNGVCLATLTGHTDKIEILIELKDGVLASSSKDTTIKLWDRKGNCLKTITGHTHNTSSLIELEDGVLASSGFSSYPSIKLWNREGSCLKTIMRHTASIYCLIGLKDNSLASGSNDKTVMLWDRNGNWLNTLEGHTNWISSLIELKDDTLATGSWDKTIKLWDRNGKCLKTLKGHTDIVHALIELKDGTLASCSHDYTIILWNRQTGKRLTTLTGHFGTSSLIELKDGTLATASFDKVLQCDTIKLWDRNGKCLKILKGHTSHIRSLVELENSALASCSEDKTIKLWSFPELQEKNERQVTANSLSKRSEREDECIIS